jgi:L-seryl-tRNA(Ser) seleniumtransferase
MAIKPPEILNRLPSVSELLEKPPVRNLVERWNRSVVAGNVRSYLEELKNDVRRRAAELPSLRELAERAASYVVSRQQRSLGAAINATGQIWGPQWTSQPLGDTALEHSVAVGREFIWPAEEHESAISDLEAKICRLTGAQAAVAVHSYSGATWLALAALASNREVLVDRSDNGSFNSGEPISKLAAVANVWLRDVGRAEQAATTNFENAASQNTAAILTLGPDANYPAGQTESAQLEGLVALSRDREIPLIGALGPAPIIDPPTAIPWPGRSVRATIAAGADLVIVRGDGLIGGPACAILVGNSSAVSRIASSPMFRAWRLDALRSAALAATLECYEDAERRVESLPIWQLLTAPIENLRNRAERIAPQLAQAAGIAAAVAVETRSPIFPTAFDGTPSYGVALTTSEGAIGNLDKRLRGLPMPIIGRVEDDRLILDLRTVLPRQDRILVETIVGATPSDEHSAQPEAAPAATTGISDTPSN